MNNLTNFLSDENSKNPIDKIDLPFFHVCTYQEASKYALNRRVNVTYCEEFEKHMIYLFLGRSEFKKEFKSGALKETPICFVFKPQHIQVNDLFPFDTGAIKLERFKPVLKDSMQKIKEDYSMGSDLRMAYQLIQIFFGSIQNYVNLENVTLTKEEATNITIRKNVPAIEDIYDIYVSERINSDNRKRTVEVHLESELLLTSKNFAGLLIPIRFQINEEFQSIIQDTKAKLVLYDEIMTIFKEAYYILISKKSIELSLEDANKI